MDDVANTGAYEAPALSVLGSFEELTLAANPGNNTDHLYAQGNLAENTTS